MNYNISPIKRQCTVIISVLIMAVLSAAVARANPLLNINVEDRVLYDNFRASGDSSACTATIAPINMYRSIIFIDYYDRTAPGLNARGDTGCYLKPLNSFSAEFYSTNEEDLSIPGKAGLKLKQGANLFMFQDGYLSLGKHFVGYYQVQEEFSSEKPVNLFRAYGKHLIGKISLEYGIDSANLGPGEYGLLLSQNVKPFPMIKLQSEDSLHFLGILDFMILNGWLSDDRVEAAGQKIYTNPKITALRLAWKPCNRAEFGITGTSMYDGKGLRTRRIWRYREVLEEAVDNLESGPGNDVFMAYDISLYLPLDRLIKRVQVFKFYYQAAGKELRLPGEEGAGNSNNWFRLYQRAVQAGLFLSTENSIFRLEYAATTPDFYSPVDADTYGYTLDGMCLGHPLGANMQSVMFRHRYYFASWISCEYTLGMYQQPAFSYEDLWGSVKGYFRPLMWSSEYSEDENMLRYYCSIALDTEFSCFIIKTFFRYDSTSNYDTNPDPLESTIEQDSRSLYTWGISISLRL